MINKKINLENYSHIHCIGIGGIGLSGLAHILLEKKHFVSGSDMNESYVTDNLIKKGAKIYLGHREKHAENADLIVYSAAVKSDNPELLYAKKNKIKSVSRAELLGALM
ncbi:MAG: Mur ligase domain-containing protein [Clostridiales Family XIII bacterium]|jgi:UDP-N-acetylmuramate--alanine ligase|nr:Mur ligase domain-containing protein [Clostridiales Family XIII bacterium]